jgi:DNA-binding MarR family transcriptional regulator
MGSSLTFDLHALTARLDRAADRILMADVGVPYRRFLALFMVGEVHASSQRALAEHLGLTEPSVSRMTGVLAEAGLLTAGRDTSGGNRRTLTLTVGGRDLVDRCRALLEERFAELVVQSGVNGTDYTRDTRRLLAALAHEQVQTPRW